MLRRMMLFICLLLACASTALAQSRPQWCSDYKAVLRLDSEPVRYLAETIEGSMLMLNAEGQVLPGIAPRAVGDFFESIAIAYSPESGGASTFINRAGELLTDYKFLNGGWYFSHNFNEGLCCVCFSENNLYGCINAKGETVIEPEYDYIDTFSEGLAYFRPQDGETYGFLNKRGEVVIPPFYTNASRFSEGLAAVQVEGRLWGFINPAGDMAIPAVFAEAYPFSDGLARVKTQNGSTGFIRSDGSFAIEATYADAECFSSGMAVVSRKTRSVRSVSFGEVIVSQPYEITASGIIDLNGQVLLPLEYDWIEIQRGANLKADEITISAHMGETCFYFRYDGERMHEIAAFRSIYEIEDALEESQITKAKVDLLSLDEGFPVPLIKAEYSLLPLQNILSDKTGLKCGEFSLLNYKYTYADLFSWKTDVLVGPAPQQWQLYSIPKIKDCCNVQPFARDALVFIVPEDHPLDNLTLEQLRGIYSGEITHWAQLCAPEAGKINAYQADEGNWAQFELQNLMPDIWLAEAPREFLEGDYGNYIENCTFRGLPGAIGFCMRSRFEATVQGRVKVLAIDGVLPTRKAIADGSYPAIDICMVTRKGEDNPNVQSLMDWVLSEQGRELIEKSGYVAME